MTDAVSSYQLSSIETSPNSFGNFYYESHPLQQVNYNAFKQPVSIYNQQSENGQSIQRRINFEYNTFGQRSVMYYGSGDEDKEDRPYRKYYSSIAPMEVIYDVNANTFEFYTYLGGDQYSAPVVYKDPGSLPYGDPEGFFLYLHRDYLGSILAITNEDAEIVEERHFDAWGQIAWIKDHNGNNIDVLTVLDRGYTGHEHLQDVKLIHMNGRLYDPVLRRFLSPDNFVQDPYNTQNFNRYGYVYNNPLMFNDPSGEWIHIVVGAVIGGVVNLAVKAAQGKINSWGDGFAAFGIGAAAGAIGAATGGVAFTMAGGAAGGAGGFLAGAAGGAVGTAFAMPVQSLGNHLYFGDPMLTGKQWITGIAIGGVTGGVVNGSIAAFNGRNFWSGNLPARPQAVSVSSLQPQGIKDNNSLSLQNAKNEIKRAIPDNGGPIKYRAEYYNRATGIDGNHNWNRTTIEIISDHGKIFPNSIGLDGKPQVLIQMIGDKYGTQGVFEIIIRDGVIRHQRFIPEGIINGIPNQMSGGVSPPFKWW